MDFPAHRSHTKSVAARGFAVAVSAAAIVSAGMTGASAAGLLEPLPDATARAYASAPPSPVKLRDRLVRLDTGYVESTIAPLDADRARNRLRRAANADAIEVELFPGTALDIERDRLRKSRGAGGGYVWSGSMADDPVGYAVFVLSGRQMTGQIFHDGRLFRIKPVDGDVHRVTELDQSRFPPERFVRSPVSGTTGSPDGLSAPTGKSRIKVLVPFTRKARKEAGNIRQTAKLAIELANLAARNGGAKIRYKFAGVVKTKYRESSHETDLTKVQRGKGKLRIVHRKRKRKNADLVALLRKSDNASGICGIGYFNKNPTQASRAYGFSVTSVGCVDYHSVAHEMGHNIGLDHDRYVVDGNPPKSEFHFGYSNVKARLRSVMAYANKCYDRGVTCTRVPMYSSSRKKYEGDKLGKPKGKKGAADASRTLTRNGRVVKKFY